MINAKEELLEMLDHVKSMHGAEVVCASINFDNEVIELFEWHDEKDFNLFLSKLDFEYHNGYGIQGLFGKVWLTNGVWLDRSEYDGSEWWDYYKYPQIHSHLLTIHSSLNQ